jgi:hypothetical protein
VGSRGDTPSPSIFGIFELAENLEIIYDAQSLRGKIFSRKDLARLASASTIEYGTLKIDGQGWMNIKRLWKTLGRCEKRFVAGADHRAH